MKKLFILLIVIFMLVGLTFTSFAKQNYNGNEYAYNQEDGPLRDGSCQDCPDPEECDPIGDGPQYRGDK